MYNTLRTLVDGELLRKFKFPHTTKIVYDIHVTKHHHYFLKKGTGQLIDVGLDLVEVKPKLKRPYQMKDVHGLACGKRRLASLG